MKTMSKLPELLFILLPLLVVLAFLAGVLR